MIAPSLGARIEKRNRRASQAINRSQVSPLVAIAFGAGASQIQNFSLAAVFNGDDVVNVMRVRRVILMNQTIFAMSARSL